MASFSGARKWTIFAASALALWSGARAAIPAPWSQTDIGSVGTAGSGNESGGTFTVAGAGADIWGNADAFHYVYQRLNGNSQVVVRVASVQNTNTWSKAGIMIRESLTAGSRHASLFVTPGNGVSYQSRAATGQVSISGGTTGLAAPQWIKLTRSGNQFSAFRSSDGVTWTAVSTPRTIDMEPVVWVGFAVTGHNGSALCTSTFTNFQLLPPPVLFVTASSMLNAGDAAVKKRLQILGYNVISKTAAASVSGDANGKDLVVISSTITSSEVNTKFRNSTVPVVTWENALLDDFGMTGNVNGTDFGSTTGQTNASIYPAACNRSTMYTSATGWLDGCQDMTGGLTGTLAITKSAATFSWGVPNANALKIAYHAGNTSRAVVFGYDKGAAMPGLTAPARRVFLFMDDNSATLWTGRGQSLFDNAVYWATNTKYYLTKKVLVLNYTPTLTTQGNVRLDQYGKSHWGWNDPMAIVKDYLADITEASGGYVRWKWANYSDIPNYMNRWVPITGAEQFKSATFTEQDYLNAYNIGVTTGDWGAAGRAMPSDGSYTVDYNRILNDFNVNTKVTAGEVDEVVVYSPPFSGFYESVMAGGTAYDVNGPTVVRANVPNIMVMGLNYERGLSEALESFGHRVEWLLDRHAFKIPETIPYNPCYWPDFPAGDYCGTVRPATPQRNIYDRFSVVDGNLPGQAGVGAAHWAPNARTRNDEYNWGLANTAYSQADDWQFNYPNLVGAASKRLVNASEWTPYAQDGNAGRGFKKWWYYQMPRVPGHYVDAGNAANNRKLNNWWEYTMNFNKHPETR